LQPVWSAGDATQSVLCCRSIPQLNSAEDGVTTPNVRMGYQEGVSSIGAMEQRRSCSDCAGYQKMGLDAPYGQALIDQTAFRIQIKWY
jgi:hypothetical protein